MADAPLGTIVTINFQELEGLKATFASLADLDPRAFQHVVIDGGSTDGSAEWARSNPVLSDTTVVSERDSGIYDAMNKGLSLARGYYCMFINSGDELLVGDELAGLLRAATARGNRWLVGRCLMASSKGHADFIKPDHWSNYSWWKQTFFNYEVCHPSVAVQTSLLKAIGGFDVRYAIAADYKLMTAIGRHHKPLTTDLVLSRFMRGGVSDVRFADSLLECHRARLELLPWLRPIAFLDLLWTRLLIKKSARHR